LGRLHLSLDTVFRTHEGNFPPVEEAAVEEGVEGERVFLRVWEEAVEEAAVEEGVIPLWVVLELVGVVVVVEQPLLTTMVEGCCFQ
jgi:hypothetical protein